MKGGSQYTCIATHAMHGVERTHAHTVGVDLDSVLAPAAATCCIVL